MGTKLLLQGFPTPLVGDGEEEMGVVSLSSVV